MPGRRSVIRAVVVLVAAGIAGCTAPDSVAGVAAVDPTRPGLAIAPPSTDVATGVSIDAAWLGKPGLTAWDKWSSLVGKRALYIMWYTDWSASAFVWFNYDKETDWRVESSPAALIAFKSAFAGDSYFVWR